MEGLESCCLVETARRTLKLAGEEFAIDGDGELVYLRHERWSFVGIGETIEEAAVDLKEEVRATAIGVLKRGDGAANEFTRFMTEFLSLA